VEEGEITHYEVLSAIAEEFRKKLSAEIRSILKKEKDHH